MVTRCTYSQHKPHSIRDASEDTIVNFATIFLAVRSIQLYTASKMYLTALRLMDFHFLQLLNTLLWGINFHTSIANILFKYKIC